MNRSILEIIKIVRNQFPQHIDLNDAEQGEKRNRDGFVLISQSKVSAISIILGKLGFTVALDSTRPLEKYIHLDVADELYLQLSKNELWNERFNPKTKTKKNNGYRDLKAEYGNITIVRLLKSLNLPSNDKLNSVFLCDNTKLNKGFSMLISKHGLGSKRKNSKQNSTQFIAVHYKMMNYIESELMTDDLFKSIYVK
ncbi:hypothetical protein PXQ59_002149 [Vibrio parahaemolyticus]|nr:hypothetical protein [Vibrio parahaemolyticus]